MAATVLGTLGGDASGFSARQLKKRTVDNADLIITMTKAHRDAVLKLSPTRLRRTFTLSEASTLGAKYGAETVADLATLRPHLAASESWDIPDPISGSDADFAAVGQYIADLLPIVIDLCRSSS
jgi:protein-tyrosine phosphatase